VDTAEITHEKRRIEMPIVSFLLRRVILCRVTTLLVFCCIPIFAVVVLLENGTSDEAGETTLAKQAKKHSGSISVTVG
jgi:hypothetical protein